MNFKRKFVLLRVISQADGVVFRVRNRFALLFAESNVGEEYFFVLGTLRNLTSARKFGRQFPNQSFSYISCAFPADIGFFKDSGHGFQDREFARGIETDSTMNSPDVIDALTRLIESRWTDGASNTIILGEKHIPTSLVGLCDSSKGEPGRIDCSYLATGQHRAWHNVIQTFAFHYEAAGMPDGHWYLRPPARNPFRGNDWKSDFPDDNTPHSNAYVNAFSLGSNHPGTLNLGIGDGSVRGVSVAVRPIILLYLTHVSDGQAFSLP